jgi:hypothetical protein
MKTFEDTEGINRIHKSKKDRQHNGQKKKDNRTNNDLQRITHKTKDRVTRTQLKTGGELWCFGRVAYIYYCNLLFLRKTFKLFYLLVFFDNECT